MEKGYWLPRACSLQINHKRDKAREEGASLFELQGALYPTHSVIHPPDLCFLENIQLKCFHNYNKCADLCKNARCR